jgi:hypothetical protein
MRKQNSRGAFKTKHLASGLIKARSLPRIFHRLLGERCALLESRKNKRVHTRTQGEKKNGKSAGVLIRAAGEKKRVLAGSKTQLNFTLTELLDAVRESVAVLVHFHPIFMVLDAVSHPVAEQLAVRLRGPRPLQLQSHRRFALQDSASETQKWLNYRENRSWCSNLN